MSWRHHHHHRHHHHPPWHRSGEHGPRCHSRGPRRLFFKVYIHGVVLLLLVGLATYVVSRVHGRPGTAVLENLGRHVAALCQRAVAGGPAERAELARLSRHMKTPVSCFARGGKLLHRVGAALKPLDADAEKTLLDGKPSVFCGSRGAVGLAMRGPTGVLRGYALVPLDPEGPLKNVLIWIGVVMFVLAFASWPLVGFIVSPLERLTKTVNRVAEGDLSARSGIDRRDEVGQLARAFDAMVERLEALLDNERELIANVSHELRTPLARIRVALELAEEGNGEESRRYLRDIASDLGELEALVSDLLTSARLDLGARDGSALAGAEPIPPANLAQRAAERFAARFGDGAGLELDIEPEIAEVRGDEVLLRRVLDNLLANGHEHGGSDEPLRLVVASRPSGDAPAANGDGRRVRFSVIDRGAGLAEDDLQNIFEPFFRADRSRSRERGGVGLGLALCRRIVEAHGGHIEAESALGEGTTVWFELPPAGV